MVKVSTFFYQISNNIICLICFCDSMWCECIGEKKIF